MLNNKITIVPYLWTLALVMVGFYIVGVVLRIILNKVFEDKKEEEAENTEEDGEAAQDGEKSDEAGNTEEKQGE
jgi:flagellar biosynthesis/type III secretory pathway M-ring protein FliF/YscJ